MSNETAPVVGIAETEALLKFVLSLGQGVATSLSDGKIDFTDAANFVAPMMSAIPAFSGIGQLPKEMAALTPDEVDQLVAYVDANFPAIPNANIKTSIETALSIGAQIVKLVMAFQAAKAAAAAPAPAPATA